MSISTANVVRNAIRVLQDLKEYKQPSGRASMEVKLGYRALSTLAENLRQILLLHYVAGHSTPKIAHLMELDELDVTRACSKALHLFIVALRRCSSAREQGVRMLKGKRKKRRTEGSSERQQKANKRMESSQQKLRNGQCAFSQGKTEKRDATVHNGTSWNWEIPAHLLVAPLTKDKAYQILRISPTDTNETRKTAYRQTIKAFHPDLAFSRDEQARQHAERMSKAVNLAWAMVRTDGIAA